MADQVDPVFAKKEIDLNECLTVEELEQLRMFLTSQLREAV
jgi:hypothetical protein